jgi:hypothetical protein
MSSTTIPEAPRRATLDDLAARARRGDAAAGAEFRRRMKASLGPIVRLATRRGEGLPPVVRFIRKTFATMADGRPMPDDQYTAEITQLLCAELLRSPATGAAS